MKEKVILISLLGTSPGVVTEAHKEISRRYEIVKHYILHTNHPLVLDQVPYIEKILKEKLNFENYEFVNLEVDDINNENNLIKFFEKFGELALKIKKGNIFENIILNVAGGRKTMIFFSVELVRYLLDVEKVIDIIIPTELLQEMNNIRQKIVNKEQLSEEEIELYFFANNKYIVLDVPVIPLPQSFKKFLVSLARGLTEGDIKKLFSTYEEVLEKMLKFGIVKKEEDKYKLIGCWEKVFKLEIDIKI